MKVRLDVVEGPEQGRSFEFNEADSFLVGRSPKAHLVLDPRADQLISRAHFLVDVRPPRCIVNDLESTNGTYVNDRRIQRRELADGDVIRLGRTSIRVSIADADEALTVELAPPSGSDEATRPTIVRSRLCAGCSRDIGRWTDADERLPELANASYLCSPCAARDASGELADLGAYQLLGELGRGGMGIVYRAVHRPTRLVCAVKRILPEVAADERALRLFDREVGIQSRVRHAHLAPVIERGRQGRTCFFAVEYLAGGDAGRLVGEVFSGPVDPNLACRLVLQVLDGLDALHEQGFIHRDLKPQNILLSCLPSEGEPVAKITDYGLAKSFEEAGNSLFDLTRVGEAGGSLMFMPPEQILQYRFVRPPADVYAVGVTLYFLLTAAYTVEFPTPAQLRRQAAAGMRSRNPIEVLLEEPPIPILQREPSLPRAVAGVVDRAVRKELERRFQSAAELRDALQRALREGP